MPTAADRAIAHVRELALAQRVPAAAVPVAEFERLRRTAVLTINFHPDRSARHGRTAAAAMADDGVYRNQFETGISAGGLDPVVAGARTRWERASFAGAYDDTPPADRPRYGGLDLVGRSTGACPRFGSCHLVLRRTVLDRATFSWGDSVTEPSVVGVWEVLEPVIEAAIADRSSDLHGPRRGADRLDSYVEAQLHGPVVLSEDVDVLVADPSFRGAQVGADLAALATRHQLDLQWHNGYRLDPDVLEPEFRTVASAILAVDLHARLARPGQRLDPELIGRAARDVVADPSKWAMYGEPVQVLQELKYLWHHLVAFGQVGED